MSESLLLSIGLPKIIAALLPVLLLVIRFLLWVRKQLKRQRPSAEDMKTLLELFPDEAPSSAADIKQRVQWRAALHEFDTQTRPSLAHPLLVTPLGVLMILIFLCAGLSLGMAIIWVMIGDYGNAVFAMLYGALYFVAAVWMGAAFDEFDFRYTLMGERLEASSQHCADVRKLRRELRLTGRRDRLANRSHFLRKKFPGALTRMRHVIVVRRRACSIGRVKSSQQFVEAKGVDNPSPLADVSDSDATISAPDVTSGLGAQAVASTQIDTQEPRPSSSGGVTVQAAASVSHD